MTAAATPAVTLLLSDAAGRPLPLPAGLAHVALILTYPPPPQVANASAWWPAPALAAVWAVAPAAGTRGG
jgi:hypothetical protein